MNGSFPEKPQYCTNDIMQKNSTMRFERIKGGRFSRCPVDDRRSLSTGGCLTSYAM